MNNPTYYLQFIALTFMVFACGSSINNENKVPAAAISEEFKSYWMKGTAEITSYELEQARYGEIHQGSAVLIFVTEDFSRSKQVKLDNQVVGDESIKVLKLNLTKKFNTGIYPYSMMQSVFTNVEGDQIPRTLKITTSSQEWCGHTFTQFNRSGEKYEVLLRSYFESEGDQNFTISSTWLEDEIWNLIRISPDKLPVGKFEMVPGSMSRRLMHKPTKSIGAEGKIMENDSIIKYTLKYPGEERILEIEFSKEFPYVIYGWKETYKSGWGTSAEVLSTTAKRKKSIQIDYWNMNHVRDSTYRKELGL